MGTEADGIIFGDHEGHYPLGKGAVTIDAPMAYLGWDRQNFPAWNRAHLRSDFQTFAYDALTPFGLGAQAYFALAHKDALAQAMNATHLTTPIPVSQIEQARKAPSFKKLSQAFTDLGLVMTLENIHPEERHPRNWAAMVITRPWLKP